MLAQAVYRGAANTWVQYTAEVLARFEAKATPIAV
jgi:hypothetical protein